MTDRNEALVELYKRGALNPGQREAVEEMARRGTIQLPQEAATNDMLTEQAGAIPDRQSMARQDAMREVAEEVGPLEAFLIGTGRGFSTVGRGLGLMDPETEGGAQAMEALREQRPYTTGAGEITGTAAPFLPLGIGAGAIRSLGGRIAGGAAAGGLEGGVIASGEGQDVVSGAGLGLSIGAGAEVLFPVLGRLGRKVFQSVTGAPPKGAMLDAAGRPSPELQAALDQSGMTFDDLTADAVETIRKARPGSDAGQVARASRFQSEGVPVTKGEMMGAGSFEQRGIENQLLESASDPLAERFRQFKLRQSEAIKDSLNSAVNVDGLPEDTGNLIKDALTGRKNLLRTQKNELYGQALEASRDAGGIPIFPGNIRDSVPDADTLEDLAITAPGPMESLNKLLTKYGITDPTDEMIEAGFEPKPITVENFERVRKSLKAIERGDTSGASSVAIGDILGALDNEIENLADTAAGRGLSDEVIKPLKEARSLVTTLKRTEFNPKSLVGKLTDVKKNSIEPVLEGSKVYNKLSSKATPIEDVRKLMGSLRNSGPKGREAAEALQSTTMLDLIESGFSTESRQIDGIRTFNPIAFRKRLDSLGQDKLGEIFKGNPKALAKLKNMDKIAADLIPPSGTQPKGSASVLLDLANKTGLAAISTKIPGIQLVLEQVNKMAENGATRKAVEQAINADPETKQIAYMFDQQFPGIASALGIAGISTAEQDQKDE